MIRLLELQIRNFFSYGNNLTKIPLNFDEPTLIMGENHDMVVDGEYDSNGAGKTTILNATSYVFYGKTLANHKLDDLINNINGKDLYAAVIFQIDDVFYKIERWRKNKQMGGSGNNGVKISYGDALDNIKTEKTPATRSIDQYIAEQILKMPFDIFVRIVVFSARFESFLSLPATHTTQVSQTSILEELFRQTELTEKAEKLKEFIKATKSEIENTILLNDRIKEETNRYKDQLESSKEAVSSWNDRHDETIKNLKVEIGRLEAIDFKEEIKKIEESNSLKEAIKNIERKIEHYDNNLKSYKTWKDELATEIKNTKTLFSTFEDIDFEKEKSRLTDLGTKKEELNKLKLTIKELEKFEDDSAKTLNEYDSEIEMLIESKCPYCKQEYHDEDKLKEKRDKLNKLGKEYKIVKAEIQEHNKTEAKLTEEITSLSDGVFDTLIDLNQSENKFSSLKEKAEELKTRKNPYESSSISEEEYTNYKNELSILNKELDKFNSEYTLEYLYSNQTRVEELKKNLVKEISEVNPHEENIERLSKAFKDLDNTKDDEIDELNSLLNHQNLLLKLLTKKDSFIRQALLDANLPLLNSRLRYYLDITGLPHKVSFGKDMNIEISQFDNPISFVNLSSGQQARINLAISFSFRDVVQARHQKINFCILDECLDTGLSNLGVRLATQMIKRVAKENDLSMYVITHRDEIKSSFSKTMTAVLKGGMTKLEFNSN